MVVTPTELRKNLFKLLDEVLERGEVLEIHRKGKILKIVPPQPRRKLDRLRPHPDAIVGESDELAEIDWSDAWHPSI